jgi:hypothetical protein
MGGRIVCSQDLWFTSYQQRIHEEVSEAEADRASAKIESQFGTAWLG